MPYAIHKLHVEVSLSLYVAMIVMKTVRMNRRANRVVCAATIVIFSAIENVDEAVRQRDVLTRQIGMRKQCGDAAKSIFKHDPSLLFGLLNNIDFVKRFRTVVPAINFFFKESKQAVRSRPLVRMGSLPGGE